MQKQSHHPKHKNCHRMVDPWQTNLIPAAPSSAHASCGESVAVRQFVEGEFGGVHVVAHHGGHL